MKIILNKVRGPILIFTLLAFFSSCAFAAGINVHLIGAAGSGFGYDRSGSSKLNTSTEIQWIYGNPGAPDPAAQYFLHSGTYNSSYSGHIGDGTNGVAGTFDKNTSATSSSYLRVWENGGPGQGNYYKTLGAYSVGDPLPTENDIADFSTNYLADVPAAPNIGNITESLLRVGDAYELTLEIPVSNSNSYIELAGVYTGDKKFKVTITQGNDTYTEYTNGTATFQGLVTGTWNISAWAINYFGESPETTDSYSTLTEGAGGPLSLSVSLVKLENNYGVNDVIIPFSPVYVGSDPVTDLAELKAVIRAAAGDVDVVTAIGVWDETIMTLKGATFDDQGNANYTTGVNDLSEVELTMGDAVQVSVIQDVSFTMSNTSQ